MTPEREHWVLMGVLGFMGGIVSNILVPARRGLVGFIAAAFIGVFCGSVAGIISSTTTLHLGWQYAIAAFVGVFGDRILSGVMRDRMDRANDSCNTTVNIHGGQNNLGNTKIGGEQSQND